MCSIQIKFKSPLNAPLKICSNWTCSYKLSPQLYDWPCESERLEHELEHILTNQLVGWAANPTRMPKTNLSRGSGHWMSVVCFACNLCTVQHDSTPDHLAACLLHSKSPACYWCSKCGLWTVDSASGTQLKRSTTQAKIGNVVQYAQWNHNHPVRHFDKLLKTSFGTKSQEKPLKWHEDSGIAWQLHCTAWKLWALDS